MMKNALYAVVKKQTLKSKLFPLSVHHRCFHSNKEPLTYEEVYKKSIDFKNGGAEEFWDEQAKEIAWMEPYTKVLDFVDDPVQNPYARTYWFVGGKTNTCYNALDVQVQRGKCDKVALIYDSPVTGTVEYLRYGDLLERVKLVAGVLRHRFGVRKGDRVMIYMPMIPETIVAMLACQRIGAIHSVVFGGFSGHELAFRVKDAGSKLILCSNYGIESGTKYVDYKKFVENAISSLESEGYTGIRCLVYQRPIPNNFKPTDMVPSRDYDWQDEVKNAKPVEECVPVDSNDPTYVLYTSGTTGSPKGVVRPTGGHLVALKYSMYNIFGVTPDETFFAASDVGWVVGHSYIAYGPLIHGATGILYEGKPVGTPDAGAFWRLMSEHKVNAMFAAPTAYRAIRKEDPEGSLIRKYDLSLLKAIFVAGERCDPETLKWIWNRFDRKIPVLDNWWQTETGFPICSKLLGMPDTKPNEIVVGSCYKPVPGYDVRILNLNKEKASEFLEEHTSEGQVVIKLPLPPGTLSGLWKNDERYRKSYLSEYPGFYNTGDAGHKDAQGNVYIMSRTDDIINVAAHRLSTSEMEQVLTMNSSVSEGAVVGKHDELKGEIPVGFVVLNNGVTKDNAIIEQECIQLVRKEIGPFACFRNCIVVKRLPKTRSGKILRGILRKMVNNQHYSIPATIEDASVLDEIQKDINSYQFK
jgi:propionyl-CoA synthetase